MKLVHEKTGAEIVIGSKVKTFRDETVTVLSFEEPHKSDSTGRFTVQFSNGATGRYFPGVISARIVR